VFQSIARLRKVYVNVEDIDLFMGMTHERPCRGGADGALIGCTFVCIIGDNFARCPSYQTQFSPFYTYL
jgi:hypothetical protein